MILGVESLGEKFFRGVLGGTVAGVLKDISDVIFHNLLKITDITFWDYAGVIALKRHPAGMLEQAYSFLYQYFYRGDLYPSGTLSEDQTLFIRGAVFGAMVWFAIHTAILAFHIEALMTSSDLITSIVNSVNSVIYGMILAYVIHYLEKREKVC